MSLLDVYYKFERLDSTKGKNRRDLVVCSEIYEPIHYTNPKGNTWIYLNINPEHIQVNAKRKFGMSITKGNGDHISGVIIPEPEKSQYGYGDVKTTLDAMLFLFSKDNTSIEVFIAKGKKNSAQGLFNLLCDGELDEEMQKLRDKAKVL